LLLLAIYVFQGIWFIRTQSFTVDEPYHITAGLDAWREGRFNRWIGHPPLARLWFTLPIVGDEWQMRVPGAGPAVAIAPSPEAMAWRVRLPNLLLGVALAGCLWDATRRIFSPAAANLALALYVFSPALVAHFSLATTDGAGVLFIFATPLALIYWRRRPSWGRTVSLALVLAGLLLSKFYTPPIFLLAIAMALMLKPDSVAYRPRHWNWATVGVVMVIVFLSVWAAYRFQVMDVALSGSRVVAWPVSPDHPAASRGSTELRFHFLVPAGEFVAGLARQIDHNRRGHSSYLMGEVSQTGSGKLFWPATILCKWPMIVLLLFATALILTWRRKLPLPRDFRVIMSFPLLFFAMALATRITIGDRLILPIYPFVLLFVAGLWEYGRRTRFGSRLLVAAVLLLAIDVSRYAPDYLSYFNLPVPPQDTWRILADSSVDWGQGLLALRAYQQRHPGETIYLAYYGNVDPSVYGIRSVPLREGDRPSGTVVVSSVFLAGRLLHDQYAYRWLLRYPQKALLNHTLHVFEVPPHDDRITTTRGTALTPAPG
jgi:4-amino-4-deoxy-L-arabinose transferase-like glycosyltransferase